MRYKIWQVGFWGALTTSLLLFLYKIVNAATLAMVPMAQITYMGPPNPRIPHDISTSTPADPNIPPHGTEGVASWISFLLPLLLGLIIIFVFAVGLVSIIARIIRFIKKLRNRQTGTGSKK